jgi:ABC-type transport system, involved in lipoprotein release, permease component
MKLELLIAWRYLGAQRKSLFVSLIGIFSMLGVSIGVFALVVALAAVNGFEEEVTAQMIGKDAHFELMSYNAQPIVAYDSLINEVRTRDSSVIASSPFIIYKVGISSKRVNDGIVIYGIDAETAKGVTDIYKYIKFGNYSVDSLEDLNGTKRPGIILGSGLANRLRVVVGDKLVLQTFQSPDEMIGSAGPKMMMCVVSGIFETGTYEYDGNLAYVGIPELQRLLNMGDAVTGIQFRIKNHWLAEAAVDSVSNWLTYPYYAMDWKSKNITLLKWMNYEKFIVAAVICLIILVAAFNIISSLIMVVIDKTKEIGILRSMGFSKAGIMRVFMLMGSFIGVGGTIVGGSIGLYFV